MAIKPWPRRFAEHPQKAQGGWPFNHGHRVKWIILMSYSNGLYINWGRSGAFVQYSAACIRSTHEF